MTTHRRHTIVIVDDHLLIAKAIRNIIEQHPEYTVLYECSNGEVLLDRLSKTSEAPDIILMDLSMPVMDGFAATAWLTRHMPQVQVMALTMQADDESLINIVKAGASGYVHKNIHPDELKKALDQLVTTGTYFPEWAGSRLLRHYRSEQYKQADTLTISDREKEFLQYACTDLTYKEIGEKMFCSPRTVEGYRDALFAKLDVNSRVALALFAVKAGIVRL